MKRMKKRPRALIPLLCYGIALAAWLVFSTLFLLGDLAARAGGRLGAQSISTAEFEMISLMPQEEGEWVATDADPQMIWINPDGRTVRSLTLTAQHTARIGEMALYYIEQPGEPFSREKRVQPVVNGDGSYLFFLPAADVHALRLDPCSTVQLMRGLSVEMNTDCPVYRYYALSYRQIFALLLLPGLAASGVHVACAAWQRRKRRD